MAKSSWALGFEHLQGWRLQSLPGQPGHFNHPLVGAELKREGYVKNFRMASAR